MTGRTLVPSRDIPVPTPLRPLMLAAALTLALPVATAGELGNFDINASTRAKVASAAHGRTNVDAIGRATFTWVQRELDTTAKASAGDPVATARAHVRQLL